MANPGEVLERVREQLDTGDNTEELEARRAGLAKRLTARHVEKDRYVRLYAQGHLSEEELDAYLAGLKNQTENIRLLLESSRTNCPAGVIRRTSPRRRTPGYSRSGNA